MTIIGTSILHLCTGEVICQAPVERIPPGNGNGAKFTLRCSKCHEIVPLAPNWRGSAGHGHTIGMRPGNIKG